MKKVAIHSKDIAESKLFFVKQIFTELENYGVEIIISKDFDRLLHSINFRPNIVGTFSAPHHLSGVDLMLSVGGPVVVPQSNNFIIAPVSPHNLNVRPLIVPSNSVIAFEIEGRSKNFLVSLDSRSRKVDNTIQMAVRKCNYTCKMVRLDGDSFLKTLREKLNWGMDIRNYLNRY